ncbi:MAG: para-nitrobenzyl esterase [Aliidongia sp.]|nr:para-nitrobenzyl esterase [Aliidongia sp.]
MKPDQRGEGSRGRNSRSRRAGLGILVTALVAMAVPFAGATAGEPTVVTTTGTFTAVPSPSEAGVNVFFGIRYAAPPEGSLRWAPPEAPVAPAGTVVASTPGNACPQPGNTAPLAQSEDCLFLNVYVPAHPHADLPVFYWIHGGALVTGTGAQYDPSVMVARSDIIVVTINYRLGALGWLAEPGLLANTASSFQNIGDAGNYGLMDQQFGMQWVQSNIKSFGGDPTQVTIGGESAGGLSVSGHLASTTTAPGLFRGAIIESGGYMLHDVPSQQSYAAVFGPGFDAVLGCVQPADAACLRGQPAAKIVTAQGRAFGANGISPNFGTRILPLGLHAAFSTGNIIRVPVLQGSNANEGRLFEPGEIPFSASLAAVAAAGGPANFDLANPNTFCAAPGGTPQTCTYPQEINLYLAGLGLPAVFNTPAFDASFAAEYPLANFPDPFLANNAPSADEALSQIFTDVVFACNVLDSNIDLARWVPVYAYEFNDPLAPPLSSVIKTPNDEFGFPTASEHAAELQFLFNFGTPLSAVEQRLGIEMKTYWANFIVSGSPNIGTPRRFFAPWPQFSLQNAVQNLVPGPTVPRPFFNFPINHFCSTWEPIIAAE